MKGTSWFYKLFRILSIILLGLTAAFTLLGGIGTTCVAFRAEQYGERMAPLIPVKPIFQVLVVVSIAAALFGIYCCVQLARGKAGSYRNSLIFLLVAGGASAVQYYYSLTLRGSTAPNNVRLYLTILTLIVLLVLRLPGLRQRVNFERDASDGDLAGSAGAALILSGLLSLTAPWWAASTHMVRGYNTANELLLPLTLGGATLVMFGIVILAWGRRRGWLADERVSVGAVS